MKKKIISLLNKYKLLLSSIFIFILVSEIIFALFSINIGSTYETIAQYGDPHRELIYMACFLGLLFLLNPLKQYLINLFLQNLLFDIKKNWIDRFPVEAEPPEDKIGQIYQRYSRGVMACNGVIVYLLSAVVPAITKICVVITSVSIYFDLTYTLILAAFSIVYITSSLIIISYRKVLLKKTIAYEDMITTQTLDYIGKAYFVNIFKKLMYIREKWKKTSLKYKKFEVKTGALGGLLDTIQHLSVSFITLFFLLFFSLDLEREHTVSEMTSLIFLSHQLFSGVSLLVSALRSKDDFNIEFKNFYSNDIFSSQLKSETKRIKFLEDNAFSFKSKSLFFTVEESDKVIIYGSSGVGKSTLLKELYSALKDYYNVQYVPQKFYTLTGHTSESLFFQEDISSRQEEYLSQLGIAHLVEKENISTGQLSGGESRKINLARAMNNEDSSIFLIDEPTSELDKQNCSSLLALIKTRFKNATLIVVSHEESWIRNDFFNKKIQIKDIL